MPYKDKEKARAATRASYYKYKDRISAERKTKYALGMFGDNAEGFRKALAYLEKHEVLA